MDYKEWRKLYIKLNNIDKDDLEAEPLWELNIKELYEKAQPTKSPFKCPECKIVLGLATTATTVDKPNETYYQCSNCLRRYSKGLLESIESPKISILEEEVLLFTKQEKGILKKLVEAGINDRIIILESMSHINNISQLLRIKDASNILKFADEEDFIQLDGEVDELKQKLKKAEDTIVAIYGKYLKIEAGLHDFFPIIYSMSLDKGKPTIVSDRLLEIQKQLGTPIVGSKQDVIKVHINKFIGFGEEKEASASTSSSAPEYTKEQKQFCPMCGKHFNKHIKIGRDIVCPK